MKIPYVIMKKEIVKILRLRAEDGMPFTVGYCPDDSRWHILGFGGTCPAELPPEGVENYGVRFVWADTKTRRDYESSWSPWSEVVRS